MLNLFIEWVCVGECDAKRAMRVERPASAGLKSVGLGGWEPPLVCSFENWSLNSLELILQIPHYVCIKRKTNEYTQLDISSPVNGLHGHENHTTHTANQQCVRDPLYESILLRSSASLISIHKLIRTVRDCNADMFTYHVNWSRTQASWLAQTMSQTNACLMQMVI